MVKRRLMAWLSGGGGRARLRRLVARGGGIEDAVASRTSTPRAPRLPAAAAALPQLSGRKLRARRQPVRIEPRRDGRRRRPQRRSSRLPEVVAVGVLWQNCSAAAQVPASRGALRVSRRQPLTGRRPLRRVARARARRSAPRCRTVSTFDAEFAPTIGADPCRRSQSQRGSGRTGRNCRPRTPNVVAAASR
jgi:hypothetical protein